MPVKTTKKQFIARAQAVHQDKFDYSQIIYVNSQTKVKILCKACNQYFNKRPSNHIYHKQGCPLCSPKSTRKISLKDFIKRSNKIHNNKYKYNLVNYKNNKCPVKIICPKHGVFNQRPDSHLFGKGCKYCSNTYMFSIKEFIRKAIDQHGDLYDYSLAKYSGYYNNVDIICSKHGVFSQRSSDHLKGSKCPKCSYIKYISNAEREWLDFIKIPDEFRQKHLFIKNKRFVVDAYVPSSNTIYEFYGDYWHGNPKKFNPDKVNKRLNKKFKDIYKKTIEREKCFIKNGFKVISIWEFDWTEVKREFHES